jgi:pyruvate kinase
MSFIITQPNRAEVTDVVNAIHDGTDAIMLSEETASSQFPIEAFQMMAKIAQSAEEEFPHPPFLRRENEERMNLKQAISQAASLLAEGVGAKAVIIPTGSGSTAIRKFP